MIYLLNDIIFHQRIKSIRHLVMMPTLIPDTNYWPVNPKSMMQAVPIAFGEVGAGVQHVGTRHVRALLSYADIICFGQI